jgi:hypothetical protein
MRKGFFFEFFRLSDITVPGGYLFHKAPHFPGKGSGNLFMGKGIRIVGAELADLLNPVPIPQNATFSVGVLRYRVSFPQNSTFSGKVK